MRELRRRPKRSRLISHETLMFRNMEARLSNCAQLQFWQLWWKEWVRKPRLFCCKKAGKHRSSANQGSKVQFTDEDDEMPQPYYFVVLWLPISLLLVIIHVLPLTSVWANYISSYWRKACSCSRKTCLSGCLRIPLLLCLLVGITFLYIMVSWHQTF